MCPLPAGRFERCASLRAWAPRAARGSRRAPWYSGLMPAISPETRARIRSVWPDMLAALATGSLVREVYKMAGVEATALYHFIQTEPPDVRAAWDDAKEASGHAFMDEAMDNARGDVHKDLAQHVRTRIDTLKWAARVRNRRAYEDKATLDVNVRTVDLTRIISDANARLAAEKQGRIIDGSAMSNSSGVQDTRALALPAESVLESVLDPALKALL